MSGHTLFAYRNDLNSLAYFLQKEIDTVSSWTDVTEQNIREFITDLDERGYASETRSRKIASAKSFFKFMKEEQIIEKNPLSDVRQPRASQSIPKVLSIEDVDRLLETVSATTTIEECRDRAMVELMYATGMRVSELVGLNIRDVDLDALTVRTIGKGSKERVLPIYDSAAESIADYIAHSRPAILRNTRQHDEEAILLNRIKKSKKRPLAFQSTDQEIKKMIKKRSKIYSYAQFKINCNKLTKTEIVKKIIKIYESN